MVRRKNTLWAVELQYDGQIFVLGALFENVFSPKSWQQNSPKLQKNKMLGFYRLHKGFLIPTCKFDAENTPDACIARPRLVLKDPGPENRVQGPGA